MSRFTQGVVLTSSIDNHDIRLELWGASTKHPDSVFWFSDWEAKNSWANIEANIYQWLLWCASRLTFPFHSVELAEFAKKLWDGRFGET